MQDRNKTGLIILILGGLSFIFWIIGIKFGNIPWVLSIVMAAFAAILRTDEKRNGSSSPLTIIGFVIAMFSAFMTILFFVQSRL